jgi:hypothetical protein
MRYQPQGLARIDWASLIGRSLVASANPGTPYTLGLNKPAVLASGASRVGSSQGIAFQHAASNGGVDIGASGGLASLVAPGNPFSIFLRIYVSVLGARQGLLGDDNSGGTGSAIDLEITAANAWRLTIANVNSQQEGGTFGTVTTGWHDVLVTYVPLGTITLYVDGVSIGAGSSIATIRTGTSLRVGSFGAYPSLGLQGRTVACHIFNRALSAADAQALTANPWQLFAAPDDEIDLIAAPAGDPGTLAWTEADDAVSIGGVLTDPAMEGWTETDDAHALAGTVTDRAAATWTEADDVHALVAVVNDSDALWWVEADDVVSITGTVQTPAVPVTGSLAWTEQDDGFAAFLAVATGGAGGYGKSKRRYVVRKGGQLYAFSDPAVAEAFLHADDEPAPVKQYPAKKKAKQPAQPAPRPAPVPEQQVDLAELRALAARQHAEAEYQQLMAQRRYEAMLILLERLREDEEDDWLLMAAE